MIYYKIRRVSDGKFSNGGSNPRFNDTGKLWDKKGSLNGHITMVMNERTGGLNDVVSRDNIVLDRFYQSKNPYLDCEVVECELVCGNSKSVLDSLLERKTATSSKAIKEKKGKYA